MWIDHFPTLFSTTEDCMYSPFNCVICDKEVHGYGPGHLCWDCAAVMQLLTWVYVEGLKEGIGHERVSGRLDHPARVLSQTA